MTTANRMSVISCPKGHESADADFCSVCGAKIPITLTNEVAEQPESNTLCPDCGARHEAVSGVFCEICGYNFSTGAHGELTPAPPIPPSPSVPETVALQIVVSIDPSLRAPESPEPPADFEPVTIQLVKDSNLIGRTSERRAVFPEIALDRDDAVSHRHALLTRSPGGMLLRDVGSSNGVRLNGAEIEPLVDVPIKAGDEITVGHWTRLRVEAAE